MSWNRKKCYKNISENIQNIFVPVVEVDGVVMSKNGTDESDHALK